MRKMMISVEYHGRQYGTGRRSQPIILRKRARDRLRRTPRNDREILRDIIRNAEGGARRRSSRALADFTISMSLVGLESRSIRLPASLAACVPVFIATATSA